MHEHKNSFFKAAAAVAAGQQGVQVWLFTNMVHYNTYTYINAYEYSNESFRGRQTCGSYGEHGVHAAHQHAEEDQLAW